MSCIISFGDEFRCECPLQRDIVQMHTVEAGASCHCPHYYYLPQMRVCQMGARMLRVELCSPTAWGACFCKQYLEMQCRSMRHIHNDELLSTMPSGEGPKKVLLEMHLHQCVLCMPAFPLCVGLTLVPIQRCVRRCLNDRRVRRQKAMYWANAVTQMCAKKQSAAIADMGHPLHQIASNEDLMCMIIDALLLGRACSKPFAEAAVQARAGPTRQPQISRKA